ncbi:MAG: thioredoxin family protein [Burkholderiales bacterium]|nr:thioredoxin family protein [Burkholderiales bacterium]MBK8665317.1 thioredoxin family protein [Burkholderiales bacterium]
MPYVARFTPETLTRAQVDATAGPLVLEFGTDWCGWCRGAQPHIRTAFDEAGGAVPHLKIEDGPGRRLGRGFGVKLWPTLVFLRHGVEMARLVRPDSAAAVAAALRRIG